MKNFLIGFVLIAIGIPLFFIGLAFLLEWKYTAEVILFLCYMGLCIIGGFGFMEWKTRK
jgi:hypothetical protein